MELLRGRRKTQTENDPDGNFGITKALRARIARTKKEDAPIPRTIELSDDTPEFPMKRIRETKKDIRRSTKYRDMVSNPESNNIQEQQHSIASMRELEQENLHLRAELEAAKAIIRNLKEKQGYSPKTQKHRRLASEPIEGRTDKKKNRQRDSARKMLVKDTLADPMRKSFSFVYPRNENAHNELNHRDAPRRHESRTTRRGAHHLSKSFFSRAGYATDSTYSTKTSSSQLV